MQGWRRNKGIKGHEMVNDGKRNEVALSQVCTLNMGQSPSSDSYNENKDGLPFFQGNADFGNISPKERVWCSQPTKIANKDDILLSVRAPIGALNIAKEECCIGRGLAALSPIPSQCRMMYLFYALKSKVKILEQQGTGSTFKAVGKDIISALHIPLYPLEEQEHIISMLSCTDIGIANIHKQLAKLDTLVKSRFIEMFGDIKLNSKNWKTVKLESIADVGSSKRVFVEELLPTGIPFYRGTEIGALAEGKLITPELYITKEHYKNLCEASGTPQRGDLLMPSICPDGRIWLVDTDEPFYFKDGRVLWVHLTSNDFDNVFVQYVMKSKMATEYEHIASGTTFKELKIFTLKSLDIVKPPIALQNQFAAFVQQVNKSKSVLQKLLEKQELLRAALMQEYFG